MQRFEYIIVGAGSAGCVLAGKLAIQAVELLLIFRPVIRRRPHTHQQDRDLSLAQFLQHRLEIGACLSRLDTAQHIIATKFEDDEIEYVLSKGKEKLEVADRLASAITIVPWLTEWFPGAEPQGNDSASMVHYQDGSYVIPKYAGGTTHSDMEVFIAYSGKHGCVSNETEFIKELDQMADEGKQILFLTE